MLYELVAPAKRTVLIVLIYVQETPSTGTMHAFDPEALPPASNFQTPVGTVIMLQTPKALLLMLNPVVLVDL
jgi:hypothetical protein